MEDYKDEIKQILTERHTEYSLSPSIITSLILGLLASYFLPLLAYVFGLIAFALFYRRRIRIAHIPCPRCKEPLGSQSWIVLSSGTNKCPNCQLGIDEER